MRKISKFDVLLFSLLVGASFQTSCARQNPLIGSWRWDNSKTLRNLEFPADGSEDLKKSANAARSFVEETATKLRSNMILTYRDHECEQVIFGKDGQVLSRETIPYKLVEVKKDFLVIDQFQKGGVVKLYRDGDQSMYVEVWVGDYSYKDFFTKQK